MVHYTLTKQGQTPRNHTLLTQDTLQNIIVSQVTYHVPGGGVSTCVCKTNEDTTAHRAVSMTDPPQVFTMQHENIL